MCGISGIIDFGNLLRVDEKVSFLRYMNACLSHRGENSKGYWYNNSSVFFSHNRLSILDLSELSNQPFISTCGNYVIVFNGEIYNYAELKGYLKDKGVNFKSSGDTEVLLNLMIIEGVSSLKKIRGMYAFALYNKINQTCIIARDPYGIKPLYYSFNKGVLTFASEIKAIKNLSIIDNKIDTISEYYFALLGSIPEPYTWYKNIKNLSPGSFIQISYKNNNVSIKKFYEIGDLWHTPQVNVNKNELQNIVKTSVVDSVKNHLVSDVPIAILLSGGIDSSIILALAKEYSKVPITAITITYDEYHNSIDDEAPLASKIAQYYGVKHVIRKVKKGEFYNDLPLILRSMDQPTIDGVNSWYASKAISENGLKVALSGIGGDELFFGYQSFHQIPSLVKINNSVFNICFKLLTFLMKKLSSNKRWDMAPELLKSIEGGWLLKRSITHPDDIFIHSKEKNKKISFEDICFLETIRTTRARRIEYPKISLSKLESLLYLRNQLLRDADWSSMAHGVELRTPFVDTILLNSLSPYLNQISKMKNKFYLANCSNELLPDYIRHKKKTGFSIPVNKWISELLENKTNIKYSWLNYVLNNFGS